MASPLVSGALDMPREQSGVSALKEWLDKYRPAVSATIGAKIICVTWRAIR